MFGEAVKHEDVRRRGKDAAYPFQIVCPHSIVSHCDRTRAVMYGMMLDGRPKEPGENGEKSIRSFVKRPLELLSEYIKDQKAADKGNCAVRDVQLLGCLWWKISRTWFVPKRPHGDFVPKFDSLLSNAGTDYFV